VILKEWSEAWKIYKGCATKLSPISLVADKKWSYWYIWVTSIVMFLAILPMSIGMYTGRFGLYAFGFGLFASMALLCQFLTAKALAKKFSVDYTTHGIADYPFMKRPMYLHYAFFLRELRDQGYSQGDVANLLSFADIATPPEAPALQLSQYPVLIFLMGAFTQLLINAITNSPDWKSGATAIPILVGGFTIAGIVIAALPIRHLIVTYPKYRHQEIQRFLQWAEKDIAEEKLPLGTDLLC
jgi:hypothetical protein